MLSTALIVGFVGASFCSALTLFAACVAVGRVTPQQERFFNGSRAAMATGRSAIIDVEWRRLEKQTAA